MTLINLTNLLLVISSLAPVKSFTPLKGVTVTSAATGTSIDLGNYLEEGDGRSMVVFGTYAADFNAIEYAQRLRYYWPKLKEECGISKCALILNCSPEAAKTMTAEVDLATDINGGDVTLLIDKTGQAGRKYGVGRGWLPDNQNLSPYLKLFGMLWGLGAWATLPAVIGGYIGNPFTGQAWIEDALAVGQKKGRWPNNALEISSDGTITNKFEKLPLVGSWPRRPLELATLRLQSMMGISLSKWKELAPDEDGLNDGVLTQLGGCLVVDSTSGEVVYEWRDPGICAVCNFEDVIKRVS